MFIFNTEKVKNVNACKGQKKLKHKIFSFLKTKIRKMQA